MATLVKHESDLEETYPGIDAAADDVLGIVIKKEETAIEKGDPSS